MISLKWLFSKCSAVNIFNNLLEEEHLHECIYLPTYLSIMHCSRNLFLCRWNFHVKINLSCNSAVRWKPFLFIWFFLSVHEIMRWFFFFRSQNMIKLSHFFSFKNCVNSLFRWKSKINSLVKMFMFSQYLSSLIFTEQRLTGSFLIWK